MASTAAGYEGGSGAGGKFRKKPLRKSQTTPYDRPTTALRPAQAAVIAAEKNGWLSKLVDPASRLIAAGAQKLFSSFFQKRLLSPPPPQQPPDVSTAVNKVQPEEASTVLVLSGTKEPPCGVVDGNRVSDGNGVSELEDLLKQKTFTRSEIDRLTMLLLSRTVDDSTGIEQKSELEFSDPPTLLGGHDNGADLPVHEIVTEHMIPGAVSTPAFRSKVLEEDVASPAELAKAYMDSRPRKVSPSVFGLQNKITREVLSGASNQPFKARSPGMSLLQKPVCDVGTFEFLTPRLRGKSAIYCMARTPYSRIHPTAAIKASESSVGARGGTFSSHNITENNHLDRSKKQVLKRRSSVVENDIGSVGPIRRIRQKPNLLHPKMTTLPASGGSHVTPTSVVHSGAVELPSSSTWNSHNHSFPKSVADNSMPSTNSGYVPSQSIETAQKIFQQLDKFTPKGISPEWKIDEGESSKMTPAKLGGLARRSMETVDSLKVLQSSEDGKKEHGSLNSVTALEPPPKISLKIEEASLKKSEASAENLRAGNGAMAELPTSISTHNTMVTDVASEPGPGHPPKKQAFQMSAHEDYLELDEDVHLNGVASTQLSEGEEKAELSEKATPTLKMPTQNEAITVEKLPGIKSSANSFASIKEPGSLSDGPVTAGNATGLVFSSVPISSPATSGSVAAAAYSQQSAPLFDNVVLQNESKFAVPAVNTKFDKLPPLTFSSPVVESAVLKETKPELPNSANETVAKANGSVENDNKSAPVVFEVVKKSEDAPSPATTAPKGILGFGLHADDASVNNGLASTVPALSTVSAPVLLSSTSISQSSVTASFPVSSPPLFTAGSSLSNGFSASSSSSFATNAGTVSSDIAGSLPSFSSGSQLPNSATAPSFSSGSTLHLGTSTVASTSAALGSASQAVDNSGAKSTETVFGIKASDRLFSSKSSETATGGSGIFGYNTSTLKPTSSDSQTVAPAAISGSVFGLQATSSTALSSLSFPNQFSSSASSSVFGLNGAANFSSSASVFASNTFSSGPASVSSSLGASLTGSAVSSTSGAAASIFSSTWQIPKPSSPIFGTSPSTGFSFGSSASGSSAETPTIFASSSSGSSAASSSAPFLFGATTSSAAPVFTFSNTSTPSLTATSQSAFANTSIPFTFGSSQTRVGNNDQMTMEDGMAEDSLQVSTHAAPVFGQSPISAPSTSFMFGATPSFGSAAPAPRGSLFQFGSQQNQMAPQNPSPFQPSGSAEFNAGGGSFSLGTGGDKSNRKIIRIKNRHGRK